MEIDLAKFKPETQQLIKLLQSEEWPEAVAPFLICQDTDEDKLERAEGILDYASSNVAGKKFLDYGCGEGHVVSLAAKAGATSVGYDVKQQGSLTWENPEGYLLTTDLAKLAQHAPYDVVLIYDVLDHSSEPIAVLKEVAKYCGPDTQIYVRCHSWMSRHGNHLYRQLNKAYIQLVFTKEELTLMGLKPEPTLQYYLPVIMQKRWFQESGFDVKSESIIKCHVEEFFKRPEIMNRLPLNVFKGQFPEWQMSQVFNDYVIKLKKPTS